MEIPDELVPKKFGNPGLKAYEPPRHARSERVTTNELNGSILL
jgi:hypothetical protein